MSHNDECWLDIPGYKSLYQVSDLGRVKRYRGRRYIKATPDWKQLYADAVASGAVPSWDEMFEILLEEGMLESPLGEYIDYHDGDEAKALEELKNTLGEDYYGNVLTAVNFTNQDECWRRICIDTLVHPRDIDPIGIFWSRGPDGAQCYWDSGGHPHTGLEDPFWYLFRARVNPEGVDIYETVRMNMINDEEYEVRFHKGAKLWIQDVELDVFGHRGREVSWSDVDWSDEADLERWEQQYEDDIPKSEFEKTYPIEDWRTA